MEKCSVKFVVTAFPATHFFGVPVIFLFGVLGDLGDHNRRKQEDRSTEAEHCGVKTVALDLADESQGYGGFGHAGDQILIFGIVERLDVACVGFGEDVAAWGANGVVHPVVAFVVADEELG